MSQDNPELSGRADALPKRAETIYRPPLAGEEIVHTSGKPLEPSRNLLDITSQTLSQEPTPAALGDIEWRCENRPKTGNAKLLTEQANPVLSSRADALDKRVETIETAPPVGDEIVRPSEKSDVYE